MSYTLTVDAPWYIVRYLHPDDELRVIGVFSSAVYLRNPRNRLVVLHDRKHGLVPFGLGIKNIENFLALARLNTGMTARYCNHFVELGRYIIFVRTSEKKNENQRPPCIAEIKKAVERGATQLADSGQGVLWALLMHKTKVTGPFTLRAEKPLNALMSALSHNDAAVIKQALLGLLGLGTGLTPSADDMLSGMCTTLLWARDIWGFDLPCAQSLAEAISELAPLRTGEISAAYLRSSAAGERTELLTGVLLRSPKLMGFDAVSSLLGIGASSGADMLTGILLALRLVSKLQESC
jgi:hypothetical protein